MPLPTRLFLGLDLIETAGSNLPHGDRMDRLTGIVRQIQEVMNDARVAFDTELPFLPKAEALLRAKRAEKRHAAGSERRTT